MKYILLLVGLSFYVSVAGQTVTVSEEIQLRNDYSYDILGQYDGRILLFRNKIYKQEIQVFDPEMNLVREKEINLEDRKANVIGVVGDEDYFSVFYNYRKKGDVFVMMQQFDGDLMPIDSAFVLKIFVDQFLTPDFQFVRSEDRSKILIHTTDRDNEMDVMVMDPEEREIWWVNRFIFKNTNLRREFRKIIVSNNGEMHLMLEKNNVVSRMEDHIIELFRFGRGFKTAISYNVPLSKTISFDINFEYDNINNCLATLGLYSEKNFGRASGVYFFKHTFSTQTPELIFIPFPEELLLDVYGKNVSEGKGVGDLEVQDIILRQDGGVIMISEIKKEYSRRPYYTERTYYGTGFNYQTDFHYEDLVVFSIHPDGEPHWNTVLHKRQYSHDDNAIYSSFFVFKTPSKIRLVYNDEISRENTVSEYVIQGNGELIRNSLMSTEYQNLQLRFRDAIQVSSTEFIVPSQRQLKLNLVKVDYK